MMMQIQLQLPASLRPSTHRLYRCTWDWLRSHYEGPWGEGDSLPLQRFLDGLVREQKVSLVRLRALQSILNCHVKPALSGPPLRLVLRPPPKRPALPITVPRFHDHEAEQSLLKAFDHVLPQQGGGGMHSMPRKSFESVRKHPVWAGWFVDLLKALTPSALRQDRLRTYCGYLHRLLQGLGSLDCREDLCRLEASEVVERLLAQRSGGGPK